MRMTSELEHGRTESARTLCSNCLQPLTGTPPAATAKNLAPSVAIFENGFAAQAFTHPPPLVAATSTPAPPRSLSSRAVQTEASATSHRSEATSRPASGQRTGQHGRPASPARARSPTPDIDLQLLIGNELLRPTSAAGHMPHGGTREAIHGRAALLPQSMPVAATLPLTTVTVDPFAAQRRVRSAAAVHRVRFTQAIAANGTTSAGAFSPGVMATLASSSATSGLTETQYVPFLTTKRLV
jgi:hypothetical protein